MIKHNKREVLIMDFLRAAAGAISGKGRGEALGLRQGLTTEQGSSIDVGSGTKKAQKVAEQTLAELLENGPDSSNIQTEYVELINK
jgi:hypothetical protein